MENNVNLRKFIVDRSAETDDMKEEHKDENHCDNPSKKIKIDCDDGKLPFAAGWVICKYLQTSVVKTFDGKFVNVLTNGVSVDLN